MSACRHAGETERTSESMLYMMNNNTENGFNFDVSVAAIGDFYATIKRRFQLHRLFVVHRSNGEANKRYAVLRRIVAIKANDGRRRPAARHCRVWGISHIH